MLLKTYIVMGSLVCLWFAVGAARGWKAPNMGTSGYSSQGGSSRSGGTGGGWIFSTGGRSSSGSGGWGGGK